LTIVESSAADPPAARLDVLGMAPAEQGLDADHALAEQGHLRLVMQLELARTDGAAELGAQPAVARGVRLGEQMRRPPHQRKQRQEHEERPRAQHRVERARLT
jgi:hypothetical protein